MSQPKRKPSKIAPRGQAAEMMITGEMIKPSEQNVVTGGVDLYADLPGVTDGRMMREYTELYEQLEASKQRLQQTSEVAEYFEFSNVQTTLKRLYEETNETPSKFFLWQLGEKYRPSNVPREEVEPTPRQKAILRQQMEQEQGTPRQRLELCFAEIKRLQQIQKDQTWQRIDSYLSDCELRMSMLTDLHEWLTVQHNAVALRLRSLHELPIDENKEMDLMDQLRQFLDFFSKAVYHTKQLSEELFPKMAELLREKLHPRRLSELGLTTDSSKCFEVPTDKELQADRTKWTWSKKKVQDLISLGEKMTHSKESKEIVAHGLMLFRNMMTVAEEQFEAVESANVDLQNLKTTYLGLTKSTAEKLKKLDEIEKRRNRVRSTCMELQNKLENMKAENEEMVHEAGELEAIFHDLASRLTPAPTIVPFPLHPDDKEDKDKTGRPGRPTVTMKSTLSSAEPQTQGPSEVDNKPRIGTIRRKRKQIPQLQAEVQSYKRLIAQLHTKLTKLSEYAEKLEGETSADSIVFLEESSDSLETAEGQEIDEEEGPFPVPKTVVELAVKETQSLPSVDNKLQKKGKRKEDKKEALCVSTSAEAEFSDTTPAKLQLTIPSMPPATSEPVLTLTRAAQPSRATLGGTPDADYEVPSRATQFDSSAYSPGLISQLEGTRTDCIHIIQSFLMLGTRLSHMLDSRGVHRMGKKVRLARAKLARLILDRSLVIMNMSKAVETYFEEINKIVQESFVELDLKPVEQKLKELREKRIAEMEAKMESISIRQDALLEQYEALWFMHLRLCESITSYRIDTKDIEEKQIIENKILEEAEGDLYLTHEDISRNWLMLQDAFRSRKISQKCLQDGRKCLMLLEDVLDQRLGYLFRLYIISYRQEELESFRRQMKALHATAPRRVAKFDAFVDKNLRRLSNRSAYFREMLRKWPRTRHKALYDLWFFMNKVLLETGILLILPEPKDSEKRELQVDRYCQLLMNVVTAKDKPKITPDNLEESLIMGVPAKEGGQQRSGRPFSLTGDLQLDLRPCVLDAITPRGYGSDAEVASQFSQMVYKRRSTTDTGTSLHLSLSRRIDSIDDKKTAKWNTEKDIAEITPRASTFQLTEGRIQEIEEPSAQPEVAFEYLDKPLRGANISGHLLEQETSPEQSQDPEMDANTDLVVHSEVVTPIGKSNASEPIPYVQLSGDADSITMDFATDVHFSHSSLSGAELPGSRHFDTAELSSDTAPSDLYIGETGSSTQLDSLDATTDTLKVRALDGSMYALCSRMGVSAGTLPSHSGTFPGTAISDNTTAVDVATNEAPLHEEDSNDSH